MALRIALLKETNGNVSMQAFFQEAAARVAIGDDYMMKLINDVAKNRKNKTRQNTLSETDAESLFNILEQGSPFSTEAQE